ncbi:uncharacterized protein map3k19 isoform X1 [Polypterus senegalus]|uniref:uncharacterized protein map3k19 isoform X1 n=2 Tax=Polypterus senegalus TaxID=55291 RepID=UPI001965D3BE|nr:uncharacterized protein map3k19 isoform X1 [Polypterus senegalus]
MNTGNLIHKFLEAVLEGDLEAINNILLDEAFSSINVNFQHPETGSTALIAACEKGLTGVVQSLIKKGADITLCNHSNQTAVHVSNPTIQGILLSAVEISTFPQRQFLQAAWQGNLSLLQNLLEEKTFVDVHARNQAGLTALMLAVRDVDLFEKLEEMMLTEYKPVDVIKMLLNNHADVKMCDSMGLSVLEYVEQIKSTTREHLTEELSSSLLSQDEESPHDQLHFKPRCLVNSLISSMSKDDLVMESVMCSKDADVYPEFKISPNTSSSMEDIPLYFNEAEKTPQEIRQTNEEFKEMTSKSTVLPSLQNSYNGSQLQVPFSHGTLPTVPSLPKHSPFRSAGSNKRQMPIIVSRGTVRESKSEADMTRTIMDYSSFQNIKTSIYQRLKVSDPEKQQGHIQGYVTQPSSRQLRFPRHLAPIEIETPNTMKKLLHFIHPVPSKPILLPLSPRASGTKTALLEEGQPDNTPACTVNNNAAVSRNKSQVDLHPQISSCKIACEQSGKESDEVQTQHEAKDSKTTDFNLNYSKCLRILESKTEVNKFLNNQITITRDPNHESGYRALCNSTPPGEEKALIEEIESQLNKLMLVECSPKLISGDNNSACSSDKPSNGGKCTEAPISGTRADDRTKCSPRQVVIIATEPKAEDMVISNNQAYESLVEKTEFKNEKLQLALNTTASEEEEVALDDQQVFTTSGEHFTMKTFPFTSQEINTLVEKFPKEKRHKPNGRNKLALSKSNVNLKCSHIKDKHAKPKSKASLPNNSKVHSKKTIGPLLKTPLKGKLKSHETETKCFEKKVTSVKKHILPHVSKSALQPKKQEVPVTQRSKSATEYLELKYSDMFQEMSSSNEGPGIYEMFVSPAYSTSRIVQSSTNGSLQDTRCVSGKKHRRRNSKSGIMLENRRKRSSRGSAKQKQKKFRDKSCSDEEVEENTIYISGAGWHIKPLRSGSSHEGTHDRNIPLPPGTPVPQKAQHANHALPVIEEQLTDQLALTITPDSHPVLLNTDITKEMQDKHFKHSGNDPADLNYTIQNSGRKGSHSEACQKSEQNSFSAQRDANKASAAANTHVTSEVYQKIKLEEDIPGRTEGNEVSSAANNPSALEVYHKSELDTSPARFEANILPHASNSHATYQNFLESIKDGNETDALLRQFAEQLLSQDQKNTLGPEEKTTNSNNFHVSSLERSKADGLSKKQEQPSLKDKNEASMTAASTLSDSSYMDDTITWSKGEILGRGAYGTVYLGLTSHGQLIAIKQVTLDSSDEAAAKKEFQRLQEEVDLLKTLNHVNIVGFLGTCLEENVVSIFMEYVPGGSIANIINRFGPLPEKVFAIYTKQILQGVEYLHENRVIHRDIKGNNIMLMPSGIIKLIDFGCAKRLAFLNTSSKSSELLKSMHGTPFWMAPEVINETGHGGKSDIWSIGCTVFEMATGKPPLAYMDRLAALYYIGANKGLMPSLPEHFSENARDFVQLCLKSEQRERPSAKELLTHPFIPN